MGPVGTHWERMYMESEVAAIRTTQAANARHLDSFAIHSGLAPLILAHMCIQHVQRI